MLNSSYKIIQKSEVIRKEIQTRIPNISLQHYKPHPDIICGSGFPFPKDIAEIKKS